MARNPGGRSHPANRKPRAKPDLSRKPLQYRSDPAASESDSGVGQQRVTQNQSACRKIKQAAVRGSRQTRLDLQLLGKSH
jgi:hypothetical protein